MNTKFLILPTGQFTPLSSVTIQGLISAFVNLTLILAALLFFFSILTGGMKYILSSGNKDKVDTARRQLVNAFVGIIIVFTVFASLSFISEFFGIDLLTFEIPTL